MSRLLSPATSSISPISVPSLATTFHPGRINSHETGSAMTAQSALRERVALAGQLEAQGPQPRPRVGVVGLVVGARGVLAVVEAAGHAVEVRRGGQARSGVDAGLQRVDRAAGLLEDDLGRHV